MIDIDVTAKLWFKFNKQRKINIEEIVYNMWYAQ